MPACAGEEGRYAPSAHLTCITGRRHLKKRVSKQTAGTAGGLADNAAADASFRRQSGKSDASLPALCRTGRDDDRRYRMVTGILLKPVTGFFSSLLPRTAVRTAIKYSLPASSVRGKQLVRRNRPPGNARNVGVVPELARAQGHGEVCLALAVDVCHMLSFCLFYGRQHPA